MIAARTLTALYLVMGVACGGKRGPDSNDGPRADMGRPLGDECVEPVDCDAGDCAADAGLGGPPDAMDVGLADAGADAGRPGCAENEMCVRGYCEPDPAYYLDERCEDAMGTTLLGAPISPFRMSPPDAWVDKVSRVAAGPEGFLGMWTTSGGTGPLYVAVASLEPPIVSEPVEIGTTRAGAFRAAWVADGWVVAWADPATGPADTETGFFVRKIAPDLTMGEPLALSLTIETPTSMAVIDKEVAVGSGATRTYIVDASGFDLTLAQNVERDFRYPPALTTWNGRFVWAGISEAKLKIVSGIAGERAEKTWSVNWVEGSPGGPGTTRAAVLGSEFTGLFQSRRGAQSIEVYTLSVDLAALDGGTIPQTILGTWDLPTSTAPWDEITSVASDGTIPFASYYTQTQEVPNTSVFELGEVPRGPDSAASCAPCAAAAEFSASGRRVALGWSSGLGGAACAAVVR